MSNFREKAIFIWNDQSIGSAEKIVTLMQEGNFQAAYLHSTNVDNWRTVSRVALANALKAAGFAVYASVAVYGYSPEAEGGKAAAIVNQYGLAGCVFDIEKGPIEDAENAPALARRLFTAYKQATAKPSAFCGWAFYTNSTGQIHPLGVLKEAMALADVGLPMAYWYGGADPATASRYAESCFRHWRQYTDKPIVMAGRVYHDQVLARGDAVTAYETRCRQMGAAGMSWWVLDTALRIPDVWEALKQTPKMGEPVPPVEENMTKPIGLFTRVQGWTAINPNFNFVAGAAQKKNTIEPNPNIKPIEQEAAGKMPFLLWWDFLPWIYSAEQQGENNFPNEANDIQFQAFKTILTNRSYQAVVVSVTTYQDKASKIEDPGFISFSAQTFMNRVGDWLKANRPNVPLILACSNDFISKYAPRIANWAHNFESMAVQPTPVIDTFPLPDAKPAYLGNSPECPWWRYYERTSADQALLLFRGANGYPADVAGMAKWLNYNQTPADTTPPTTPTNLQAQVVGNQVQLTWAASTDNTAVETYKIYRGGVLRGVAKAATWTDTANPGETWTYEVEAWDAAGNKSGRVAVTATVPAAGGGDVSRAEFEALKAEAVQLGADVAQIKTTLAELVKFRDDHRKV